MSKGNKELVCFVEGDDDKIFLYYLIKNIKKKYKNKTKITCRGLGGYPKLKNKIAKRIQNMQSPGKNFLIMIDQDNEHDCRKRKNEISQEVKIDKNKRATKVKIRVACHELESFYLGDLNAVKEGLNIQDKNFLKRQPSNPDSIEEPLEELKKISGKYGNKKKGLLAKAIAPYLKIDGTNKSHSFNVLVTAIEHLL